MVEQPSVSKNHPMATLVSAFGPNLEFARELAPFTSYRTGGRAKYFVLATTPGDVIKSIQAARRLDIPFFLLGGGTNILVADSGFDGVVIKIEISGLYRLSETEVKSGAGESLMALVTFAMENSMSGLEFAAGIWGTVGGAIYGNAGAFGGEIGSVVKSILLVDREGETRAVPPEYCKFDYRDSHLKRSQEVILEATFELQPGDRVEIQKKVEDILAARDGKHPNDGKSAGCFFKNIPDATQPHGKLAAGKLLDEAGVKGLSVGGARVFEKHANIIVNTGSATSKDIRELADMMKKMVREKFGITLEEEVMQIGNF